MVEEFKCRLSATFSDFNPLSVCEIMLLFSSRVSSLPFLPMLVVDINDVKIAEVTTTSGLPRINIVYGGSLVTKMKNCEYSIIDDKHLLIFYTTAILKKVDILLTHECICHDVVF